MSADQPLDLVLELDVSTGVRMDDRTQPVTAGNVADLFDLLEHRAPAVIIESRRDRGSAGSANSDVVGSIDDHEHPSTRRGDRQAGPFGERKDSVGLARVVQIVEDERPDGGQRATRQDVAERVGILWQIPDGSELEGTHSRLLDLVEHLLPWWVVRRVREVDAPRDGTDGDAGHRVI